MIDISLPLHNGMVSYPGDAKYEEYVYKDHPEDHVHITRILMETHTGTHFDAPYHMLPDGKKVDEIDVMRFIGRVTVEEVSGSSVSVSDIPDKHEKNILFKTRNSEYYSDPEFHKDFVYVEPEAARLLVSRNVNLVGIDYLSIEKFGSEEPIVHKTLLGSGVIIMEGLNLKGVEPGDYDLICLPLRMSQDGAPCRALLL